MNNNNNNNNHDELGNVSLNLCNLEFTHEQIHELLREKELLEQQLLLTCVTKLKLLIFTNQDIIKLIKFGGINVHNTVQNLMNNGFNKDNLLNILKGSTGSTSPQTTLLQTLNFI